MNEKPGEMTRAQWIASIAKEQEEEIVRLRHQRDLARKSIRYLIGKAKEANEKAWAEGLGWIGVMIPCLGESDKPGWQCPMCGMTLGMIDLPSGCQKCGFEQMNLTK